MKKGKLVLPCLRAVIGDWVYYSSVMTAEQVSDWVMPVKDIRESKTLDEYLQRDLKDEKKTKISKYILHDQQHFFNSIIIGIFGDVPEWVSLSYLSNKLKGRKIMDEDVEKYVSESSGLMVFNGTEKMFALDGQHRVEGIKLAYTNKNKSSTKNKPEEDQFSVILVGHSDDKLGRKRSRKLFSDINKNAKPVGRLDKIKIDEEDINAIVSRRIYSEYKHFKGSDLIALSETSNLDKNDFVHFANLATLDSVCKKLKKLYKKSKDVPDWDEKNVEQFYKIVVGFYDFVFENIKDYDRYFNKKDLTLKEVRNENKYFLFRPIGLILLAKLYVHFFSDLAFFKKNIGKISFVMPHSPLNKIVWSNGKMAAIGVNQNLAFDIILYLFNKYPENKSGDLLERYRTITKQDQGLLPNKIN